MPITKPAITKGELASEINKQTIFVSVEVRKLSLLDEKLTFNLILHQSIIWPVYQYDNFLLASDELDKKI